MTGPIATIVGGQGFIGQAVHRHLRALGWQCRVTDRATVWPVRDEPLGHVFYCAGLTADYLARPADTAEAHVGLLSRVLQSDDYQSLVYLSSTRVYDGMAATGRVDETADFQLQPRHPRHLYDLTKLTGEALCHAMGQGRARIARLSCVYGAGPKSHGFLPDLVDRLTSLPEGGLLELDSSPHYTRDYVHLDDVVRALVDMAVRGRSPVYNVASGDNVSNAAIAEWVAETTGKRLSFRLTHAPTPSPKIGIDRIASELGWRPQPLRSRLASWLEERTRETAQH
ncbi:MAG: NAD(P)-dependent oxidoreductase [Rhodoferax sp.]|nr:NAD(P)-dependent oxidoreductase [Rhodoferax sp.]